MSLYFESCCKNLVEFKSDHRLHDANIVILTWRTGDSIESMSISSPKEWIVNAESWYVINDSELNSIHLYKNSRTGFAIGIIGDTKTTSFLGNSITLSVHKLKSKNKVSLKTEYLFYTKLPKNNIWMPERNECNITLNSDILDVTHKQCEVKNALTKKFVQVPTVSYATTFRKPQLHIINKLVEILQLETSHVQISGSDSIHCNESLLHHKENWKILHDTIILHPLVALPELAQVSFIDDQHDQLTCHCDYLHGERKIFAIDKALLV